MSCERVTDSNILSDTFFQVYSDEMSSNLEKLEVDPQFFQSTSPKFNAKTRSVEIAMKVLRDNGIKTVSRKVHQIEWPNTNTNGI